MTAPIPARQRRTMRRQRPQPHLDRRHHRTLVVLTGRDQLTSSPATTGSPAVWIGFALVAGVLVGAATGLLSFAGGMAVPLAVIAGGGACGGTVALFLTVVRFATGNTT